MQAIPSNLNMGPLGALLTSVPIIKQLAIQAYTCGASPPDKVQTIFWAFGFHTTKKYDSKYSKQGSADHHIDDPTEVSVMEKNRKMKHDLLN